MSRDTGELPRTEADPTAALMREGPLPERPPAAAGDRAPTSPQLESYPRIPTPLWWRAVT